MTYEQAKQMLKQVDCHGIPKGYNGGYSELNKYCLESINKLEMVEQIVEEWNNDTEKDIESWDTMERIKGC